MLVMLQNELGITGSLAELLELVKQKSNQNSLARARKTTINN